MNTFATGSLPVHFSVAKLFTFRWQYTQIHSGASKCYLAYQSIQIYAIVMTYATLPSNNLYRQDCMQHRMCIQVLMMQAQMMQDNVSSR